MYLLTSCHMHGFMHSSTIYSILVKLNSDLSSSFLLKLNISFGFQNSVLTPYYKEDVLYTEEELNKENEDGISILFYLQKIYPGEFKSHCMLYCSF